MREIQGFVNSNSYLVIHFFHKLLILTGDVVTCYGEPADVINTNNLDWMPKLNVAKIGRAVVNNYFNCIEIIVGNFLT